MYYLLSERRKATFESTLHRLSAVKQNAHVHLKSDMGSKFKDI